MSLPDFKKRCRDQKQGMCSAKQVLKASLKKETKKFKGVWVGNNKIGREKCREGEGFGVNERTGGSFCRMVEEKATGYCCGRGKGMNQPSVAWKLDFDKVVNNCKQAGEVMCSSDQVMSANSALVHGPVWVGDKICKGKKQKAYLDQDGKIGCQRWRGVTLNGYCCK